MPGKKKKKASRKSSAKQHYAELTKHGKYFCREFAKFITFLSLAGMIVLGGYTLNSTQVLGASTSIYQQQCSFWNIFCRLQAFFHSNSNQSRSLNSDSSGNPTIEQSNIASGSVDLKALPLGDGKYTNSPKQGYIYTCQTSFTGGGAEMNGSWIHGSTWDSSAKISVEGSVSWPNAKFSITTSSDKRIFSGNGLPVGYTTGIFPIQSTDPAYQIDKNPNSIKTQTYSFSLPLNPVLGNQTTCIRGVVGIAVDGIPIFDGLDAGGRDAVAHEVQDSCDGHPQESGEYHYHGQSSCLKETQGKNTLVGYALDGFGIYSMYDANGKEYTNADLDECHGITSTVLWNGKMQNIYHYVMTAEYPYSVGCFKGSIVLNEQQFTGSVGQGQGGNQSRQGQMQGGMRPSGILPRPSGFDHGMQGQNGFPPPPPPQMGGQ